VRAALGLAGVTAAPGPTSAAPAANLQSPVSQSAVRGSAQYNSTKKQRVGQRGLPARLVQEEEVEVAVRPGRQARALSDSSDDDFLPETVQQQKHGQQSSTAVSSATQPAATAAGAGIEVGAWPVFSFILPAVLSALGIARIREECSYSSILCCTDALLHCRGSVSVKLHCTEEPSHTVDLNRHDWIAETAKWVVKI
jgi:hypothetical protein